MTRCAMCGKEFGSHGGTRILKTDKAVIRQYGVDSYICNKCRSMQCQEYSERKRQLQPEIKCPFCGHMFSPKTKRPTSTTGNIVRGAVFLPWGVVSALKNKPFVQCPHCKMKIPQG